MTSSDPRLPLALALLLAACGGGGGSGGGVASSQAPIDTSGQPNVLTVSVDGPGCAAGPYLNEPCVSVTVCEPGTANCQAIHGLLLDTGSTGLRVFSQVLTLSLPSIMAGAQPVAECVNYLDGSSQWGPVVEADVVLGGEPAVRIPIQLIDATYAVPPSACAGADPSPAAAGFNGILGVATFQEDCGTACTSASNGIYFACGAGCASTALAPSSQIQNPVASLPTDNNGVIVRLPAVSRAGASAAQGALVLGIGTRGNNVPPASALPHPLDAAGEFRTTLGGVALTAFADTGSNGLFFPAPSGSGLVACPAPSTGWYCPASTVTLTADNAGASGTPTDAVTFTIANIEALAAGVRVSSQVGGSLPAKASFDWGLPFHLGRDVYVGFEGRRSVLGQGPLIAY